VKPVPSTKRAVGQTRPAATKRTHVPRGTLSREAIVEAAFELVANGGVNALSMPSLARGMSVGVTSLYWYVNDKDELLEAVAYRAAAFLTLDDRCQSDARWDELLADHFRHVRKKLEDHPGLGELVITYGLPAPAWFDDQDQAVTARARVQSMVDAGIPLESAIRGYVTVALFTLGYSAWSSADRRVPKRTRRRSVITGSAQSRSTEPSDDGFEFGLRLIVGGLSAQLGLVQSGNAPKRGGRR
jgi:AcrR family transcriptional regulator